jgi:hypothetical protein
MSDTGRREVEGRLGERIRELVEEALASANKPLSLSEIEDIALQVRERIGEAVTQELVAKQAPLAVPGPVCEGCGREMHYKGRKKRRLVTRSGEVDWERPYYYCPTCRRGLFPPG